MNLFTHRSLLLALVLCLLCVRAALLPAAEADALFERLDAAAKKIKEDVGMGKLPKDLAKACEEAKQNIRPAPGKICPDGLAILQADASLVGIEHRETRQWRPLVTIEGRWDAPYTATPFA